MQPRTLQSGNDDAFPWETSNHSDWMPSAAFACIQCQSSAWNVICTLYRVASHLKGGALVFHFKLLLWCVLGAVLDGENVASPLKERGDSRTRTGCRRDGTRESGAWSIFRGKEFPSSSRGV